MRTIPFFFLMLACTEICALQSFSLLPGERVRAQVAIGEINRIRVEGDRIVRGFGKSGAFSMDNDPETGQIFIQPSHGSKPINLTLVTEKKRTIDLLLSPRKVPSETILLKPSSASKEKAAKFESAQPFEEGLKKLINAMFQGSKISGYEVRYFEQPLKIWATLKVTQVGEFQGKKFLGQVFLVTNKSKKYATLAEKDFFIPILRNHQLCWWPEKGLP